MEYGGKASKILVSIKDLSVNEEIFLLTLTSHEAREYADGGVREYEIFCKVKGSSAGQRNWMRLRRTREGAGHGCPSQREDINRWNTLSILRIII